MFIERDPGSFRLCRAFADRLGRSVRTLIFTMHSHLLKWFARTAHVMGAPVAHPGSRWPGVLNGGGDR